MIRFIHIAVLLMVSMASQANMISRTITIDGNMADWYNAPNITTNPGQFSEDCQHGTACDRDPPNSTGRDLRKFSFTWDANYIYFYVERFASTNNTTDWLFYLDRNANGFMESDEPIFRVQWSGSNRNTNAYLCPYFPVNTTTGDPLTDSNGLGDGYTMPGGSANAQCNSLYSNVTAGATSGVEMESRLSWAQIGLPGPTNLRFHISSSTGVNLPTQVIDNMDGPGGGGGQLFPPDMSIGITANNSPIYSGTSVTFSVTLTNTQFTGFTNISSSLSLPPQLVYQSHSAPAGTSFVDSNADTIPDQWQVPSLASQQSLVLQVTAIAQPVPFAINTNTTASLVSWTGTDSDPANNSSTAVVQVLPVPELSVVKVASTATADPGNTVSFTSTVSNISGAAAHNVVLRLTLDPFTALRLNTYGVNQHVQLNAGASGLSSNTVTYSNNGGATFTYLPVSGGGGAPAGFDANVTTIRLTTSGSMAAGSNFSVLYDARIR
jgi:uncharacterized repeat protein (TIGR01451 family)